MWFYNRTPDTIQDNHTWAWYKLFSDYLWFWNIWVTLHHHHWGIRGMLHEVSMCCGEPTFSSGTFCTLDNLLMTGKSLLPCRKCTHTQEAQQRGRVCWREPVTSNCHLPHSGRWASFLPWAASWETSPYINELTVRPSEGRKISFPSLFCEQCFLKADFPL